MLSSHRRCTLSNTKSNTKSIISCIYIYVDSYIVEPFVKNRSTDVSYLNATHISFI